MNSMKRLRAVLSLNLLVVFVQFTLAGLMLGGTDLARKMHGITGLLLIVLAVIQTALVIVMRRDGVAPRWLVGANVGILAAEMIEAICGHYHVLGLHVPLGVAIFGGVLRQLFWAMAIRPQEARSSI
jgi:hypothetical protein